MTTSFLPGDVGVANRDDENDVRGRSQRALVAPSRVKSPLHDVTGDSDDDVFQGGSFATDPLFFPNLHDAHTSDFALAASLSVPMAAATHVGAGLAGLAGPIAAANEPTAGTLASLRTALDDSNTTYTGAGITIGVLSDSFNDLGGETADIAAGVLPSASSIKIIEDLSSNVNEGQTDEGRAMTQVAYAVAPGASFDFYTAFVSETDYAHGIEALADAGCKVIVEDAQYFDEAMFRNGPVAQAVEYAVSKGVVVLGAAGNQGGDGYEAAWNPTSTTYDNVFLTNAEQFGAGVVSQSFTLNASDPDPGLELQVDQPIPVSGTDYEAEVFSGGSEIYSQAFNGDDEYLDSSQFANKVASGSTFELTVQQINGTAPTTLREVGFAGWNIGDANSGTVYGAAQAPGMISVGAADIGTTPAYGVSPPTNESFSASGAGSELLFDDSGTRLATPDTFNGVTLTGVDAVDTSVFDPFYGTSAAAPSIAGVVAQMLQADPKLTPAQVTQMLDASATPTSGGVTVGGAGLVRANVAIAEAVAAACYARGTRIATACGERAIETLAVNDLVLTASGALRPVRWVGKRTIDIKRHPDPAAVQPVRVSAGAFGEGLPRRDLWLSPGHNIAWNGALIAAAALVNGRSVVQVEQDHVEYWHVELDAHDVILAEGLPAESYLDTGNRAAFASGAAFVEAHPDFRPRHWADTCLPLALDGPPVVAAKTRLLARLAERGLEVEDEADPHVRFDGVRIEPMRLGQGRFAFALPEGGREIALVSRSFTPAHTTPDRLDTRTLGLCVGDLQIDGAPVALDDDALCGAGWRQAEFAGGRFSHRWTNGETPLPSGARIVFVRLAGAGAYWRPPHLRLVAQSA